MSKVVLCKHCGKKEDLCMCDVMNRNHKGQWCKFNWSLRCQEGYCSNCLVYRDKMSKEGV